MTTGRINQVSPPNSSGNCLAYRQARSVAGSASRGSHSVRVVSPFCFKCKRVKFVKEMDFQEVAIEQAAAATGGANRKTHPTMGESVLLASSAPPQQETFEAFDNGELERPRKRKYRAPPADTIRKATPPRPDKIARVARPERPVTIAGETDHRESDPGKTTEKDTSTTTTKIGNGKAKTKTKTTIESAKTNGEGEVIEADGADSGDMTEQVAPWAATTGEADSNIRPTENVDNRDLKISVARVILGGDTFGLSNEAEEDRETEQVAPWAAPLINFGSPIATGSAIPDNSTQGDNQQNKNNRYETPPPSAGGALSEDVDMSDGAETPNADMEESPGNDGTNNNNNNKNNGNENNNNDNEETFFDAEEEEFFDTYMLGNSDSESEIYDNLAADTDENNIRAELERMRREVEIDLEKQLPKAPSQNLLRIGTINVQAAGGKAIWNLHAAAKEGWEHWLSVFVCTETKISNQCYPKTSFIYNILASEDSKNNRGGVAIFYQTTCPLYTAEDGKIYDTNVVALTVVSGKFRRRLIGVYLSPTHIEEKTWLALRKAVQEARDPIWFLGDFNVDLHSIFSNRVNATQNAPSDERSAEIQGFLASVGVTDFGRTKIQRKKSGVWTWSMKRRVRGVTQKIKATCDYILGPSTDSIIRHRVRDCNYIRTDHRMVYVDIAVNKKQHEKYRNKRRRFPTANRRAEGSRVDKLYKELVDAQEKPVQQEKGTKAAWIAEDTWRLIRQRKNARGKDAAGRKRHLKRKIQRYLARDRKRRADDAATAVEKAFNERDHKAGFQTLQKWYKHSHGVNLPMSYKSMADTSNEWTDLYSDRPPQNPMFSLADVERLDFQMDDGVFTKDEIREVAKRLKSGKAPGPTGLKADTIKEWSAAEPGTEGSKHFDSLVELCNIVFTTGEVPQAMREGILVLIPKAGASAVKSEYRGITLLESVYKVISSCLNRRAMQRIQFHDSIHGFRPGRGCQTALVEAKRDMKAREQAGKPYHQVFLDLSKAFDTVNRDRLFQIMEAYGFGRRALTFFRKCWEGSFVAPRAAQCYGPKIPVNAGVRQGDVISPLLFNLVVDAICRITNTTFPRLREEVQMVFYADDGRLGGENSGNVQRVLNFMSDCFERVGLKVNNKKTVAMDNDVKFRARRKHHGAIRGQQRGQPEYEIRQNTYVHCPICRIPIQNRSLRRHCVHKHPENTEHHQQPEIWSPGPSPSKAGVTYTAYWETDEQGKNKEIHCPAPDCLCFAIDKPANLQQHWATKFHAGTLRIVDARHGRMQEIRFPYQCGLCKVWRKNPIDASHAQTKFCQQTSSRLLAQVQQESYRREMETSPLKHGDTRLSKVSQFNYLGRVLTAKNEDVLAVHRNLQKAKRKWGFVRRILSSEPISIRTYVRMYKTIVMSVLLYGCETWELPPLTVAALEAFHNRCVRVIMNDPIRMIVENGNVVWVRPAIQPLLDRSGLFPLSTYIRTRKATLSASYVTKSVSDRCSGLARPGVVKRKLIFDSESEQHSDTNSTHARRIRTGGSSPASHSSRGDQSENLFFGRAVF